MNTCLSRNIISTCVCTVCYEYLSLWKIASINSHSTFTILTKCLEDTEIIYPLFYFYLSFILSISHFIYLSFYLPIILTTYHYIIPIYHSLYLSFSLSIILSIYHSLYLSFSLSIILSIYHSLYLSFYLSIILSIYHFLYLSLYLSIILSIYNSIFLSFYPAIISLSNLWTLSVLIDLIPIITHHQTPKQTKY